MLNSYIKYKNIDGIFLNKSRFKFITTNDIDTIKNVHFPDISNGYVNYFVITNSTHITGYESGDNLRGCQNLINYDGTLKRRYKTNGVWGSWDKFILNSDLPIIESHVVNPNGSDNIEIILNNYTITEKFIVSMTSYNVDVGIIGATATSGGKGISVRLTQNYTGDLRINIMYYKVK